MKSANYNNSILKQLEEVMQKCNDLSQEIKNAKKESRQREYKIEEEFKKEIKEAKQTIKKLEDTIVEKDKKITKLENEVDRLKKQINNDSNNSSKPPSSDIKSNIPNNREKSEKPRGGQLGHKAQFLDKKSVEEKIEKGEYKHQVIDVGDIAGGYVSKYVLDIEISVVAKEYRFYKDKTGKYNIPKEFQPNVQYGNELKTICCILNTEGIVAIDRLTDFVTNITHGKITVSNGSAVNFVKLLSSKCKSIVEQIKTNILNSEILNTDATTGRCNNRNICVRNYSTKKHTLLIATKGKGKKHIEETSILPKFTGDLVHDHETVMYNYGKRHGECNAHITRYLKGNYENTVNKWSLDMKAFLCCLNRYKQELISNGIQELDESHLDKYSKRYDEILEDGYKQNEIFKSQYYKKEEKKLLNRLVKYKENHLLFLYDFSIPFDNNLSERDLRHVKNKQKISGYWASMEGLQNYLDIKSVIGTCKKQGRDFYKTIFDIYEGIPVVI